MPARTYRLVVGVPLDEVNIDADSIDETATRTFMTPDERLALQSALMVTSEERTVDLSLSGLFGFSVPENAVLIQVSFIVDDEITSGDGAIDWRADLTAGTMETLTHTQNLAASTNPTWAGNTVCVSDTDIAITSDTGTLSGGTLRATVVYSGPPMIYDGGGWV
jgi:hypothetical protein